MSAPQKLSILIPAYNEGQNISQLLQRVVEVKLPYGIVKQMIVVDDGSNDDTYDKAVAFCESFNKSREGESADTIEVMRHTKNQGKGAAIRTALKNATDSDYIIIQDADLELEPADIATLLQHLIDNNLKVVYGSRFLGAGNTHLYRRFYWGGRLVSMVANILYGQHITDEPTCYKLFRREILERIRLRCKGFEFCPEVTAKVAKQGIKISEVPIHYTPRTLEEGKKLRWTDGLEAVLTLIKYRFVD